MTKLSNNTEYQNNSLPAQFAEYLISNGFTCTVRKSGSLEFIKKDVLMWVKDNRIYVVQPNDDLSQCAINLTAMSMFNWIMLLHILQVQSIQNFIKNTDAETAYEMRLQIQTILKESPSLTF